MFPSWPLVSASVFSQRASASVGALILSAAIGEQPRLLPQSHDPSRPALNRFLKRGPRNSVITSKSDQLLDVAILVVPELDGIRKIERPPHSHAGMGERRWNGVKGRRSRYGHASR